MASDVFVDTSGFYSLLAQRDERDAHAARILARAARQGGRFVTIDYVLDETATLLKARGAGHLAERLFQVVRESKVRRIE